MVYEENERIGKRLKKIRQNAGLDYPDMAEVLEVSEGHYRKIERGVYGLDVKKIIMLYQKMKVDPLYLLTGKRGMDTPYKPHSLKADKNTIVCELLDYCKKQLADTGEE
ncbi:MAG: helix-turn-helix transcriptional regulator [Lachnospiraceae bacterium]|nr:helix-turn-helix transcriptional regulator [Lachnospiraceae bacterium]